MKNSLVILFVCFTSITSLAQVNYQVGGVNSWGLFGRPSVLEDFGLSQQVSFDDPNPKDGSIRGFASINVLTEVVGGQPMFQAYMTSYAITWVYLNGKWQTIKQVMKCTGAEKFELRRIDFQVRHSISIEEDIMNHPIRMHTITPPGGHTPYIREPIPPGGTIIDDVMPYTASVGWPGLSAVATFIIPTEVSLNAKNVGPNCGTPKKPTEEEKKVTEAKGISLKAPKPKAKSGMSITESIKAKMALIGQGYSCVNVSDIAGSNCNDNAIRIQNSCSKSMKVQIKTATGSEIYTVPARGNKTVTVGCGNRQKTKFAAIPASSNINNLFADREWFLIGMIDKTGKTKVDVPYDPPKPVAQQRTNSGSQQQVQTQGGGLGDVYYPNQNKTKTYKGSGAKDFQNKMNSTEGFDITKGFFGYKQSAGTVTQYTVYRFGNHRWQGGNTWFKAKIWRHDPTGQSGDAKSFYFTLYGKWERKADEIIVTIQEAGRTAPNPYPYVFKIEGSNLRLIKGPVRRGTQPPRDDLYSNYSTLPNWPKMDEKRSSLTSGFPPRN